MATNNLINNDTANKPNEIDGLTAGTIVSTADPMGFIDASDTTATPNGTYKKIPTGRALDSTVWAGGILEQSDRKLIDYDPTIWPNTSLYWNRGTSRSKLEPPSGGVAPPLVTTPAGVNFNYMEFTRANSNGFTETASDIADYFDPSTATTREAGAVMFIVGQVDGSVIGSGKMAFGGWNGPSNGNAALLVYDRTSQKLELFNETPTPNPQSTDVINNNQLYCFALRKDNLDLNVFIDGVQDSALDITYTVGNYPTSNSFNLGFEYDTGPTPSDYLEGRIYRALVYDIPMSDQWISDMSRRLLDYYSNPYVI